MNSLYLYDFFSRCNPIKELDIKYGVPYFVIGVETYTREADEDDDEYEEGYTDDESDIFRLKAYNAEIKLLGVVKNPKYLGEGGHMLQVALVTFKEKT